MVDQSGSHSVKSPSYGDEVKSLRDALAVFAVFLYYTGFMYQYNWYNNFNLNVLTIDPPLYYVLISAWRPYKDHPGDSIAALLIVATLLVAVRRLRERNAEHRYAALFAMSYPIAVIVAALGLFQISNYFAWDTAQFEAAKIYRQQANYSTAVLRFSPGADNNYPGELIRLNRRRAIKLLGESKDSIFVVGPQWKYHRSVFRVRKSDATLQHLTDLTPP